MYEQKHHVQWKLDYTKYKIKLFMAKSYRDEVFGFSSMFILGPKAGSNIADDGLPQNGFADILVNGGSLGQGIEPEIHNKIEFTKGLQK